MAETRLLTDLPTALGTTNENGLEMGVFFKKHCLRTILDSVTFHIVKFHKTS